MSTTGATTAPERKPDSNGAARGGARGARGLTAGLLLQRYALLLVWALVIAVFGILRPDTFLTDANFQTIFSSQAILLILTLGLLFSLATGEFDLSIAAVVGFAASITAWLNVEKGLPIVLAILIVLVVALALGTLNAFLVVKVGVPSLIATLGSGTLLTGIAMGLTNSRIIGGVSSSLVDATSTRVFGLPLTFYYGLLLCVIVWYVFVYTPVGRYIRFVAEGPEVARLAGIRVDFLRGGSLVLTALVAGIAGVLLVGVQGGADATAGSSYLLPAFAAAFLGATAIRPGEFNAWGTFAAVYFLVTGITGLQLMGLEGWVEQVFYGSSLVIAVTLSQIATKRSQRGAVE